MRSSILSLRIFTFGWLALAAAAIIWNLGDIYFAIGMINSVTFSVGSTVLSALDRTDVNSEAN